MSAQNPYKAAGIIAVIYFSLLALIGVPAGLCFMIFSGLRAEMLLVGVLLIALPIMGIVASAFILSRGPNNFSLAIFGGLTLLLCLATLFSFFVASGDFSNVPFYTAFAFNTGLFGWLTFSMWRYMNVTKPENIAEIFDEKE